jgi:Tol biopolymer transport system component
MHAMDFRFTIILFADQTEVFQKHEGSRAALKKITILGIGAVAIIALLLISSLVQDGSEEEQFEIVPRESKIPENAVKVTPETDLFPPQLHSDEYAEPVPMPGPINTAGAEDSPFITPDGGTFYFFFTPGADVPVEEQITDKVTGIYVSKKVDGEWSEPQRVVLQDPGKLALDGCPFVEGDTMWFCSAREGYTGVRFLTADCIDGKWQNWEWVGDKLTFEYEVGELHISADGSELYFHSPRPGGKGKVDIWVSKKVDGEWQEPENVEAVNTAEVEGWPFLSQDGEELWFTRFHLGYPAIFRSERINGEWQEPELIISQFAAEPTLDNEGNIYFCHHFFKDAKIIEADIYVAYKKTPSVPHEERWGIYALDLATEEVVLIHSSSERISYLRLNNAGDRFLFSQRIGKDANELEEICTMGIDGLGLTRITNNSFWDLYPSWSPDDSEIAFLSWRENDLDIYAMNADGSNVRKLYDSGSHDADIHWVGERIVFTSHSQIWSINDDGTDPFQITDPPNAGQWGNANLPFGDYDPRFSPDGSKLAFERLLNDSSIHGNYDIFVVNADGTGETRLTDSGYSQGLASWSHSGDKIVYIVAAIGSEGKYDIHIMNSDGTDSRNITPDYFPSNFLCHSPIFSLDDSKIFFIGEWWE